MQQTLEDVKQKVLESAEQAGGTWGIVVEDLDRSESFALNSQEVFTAESIIKVPIMAAVFAAIERGEASLNDYLTLKQEDMVGGSGVLFRMSAGIQLPVQDYLTLMIIQSDNTATNMLIDLIGAEQVQQTMADIGMKDSRFRKKLMTYPAGIAEKNVITAADVNLLLKKLTTGDYLSRHACEQMINIMKKQQVRNGIPAYLPESDSPLLGGQPLWELANKTGWDTGSQHDAGIFFANQRTFTITILSKDVDAHVALDTQGKIGKVLYEYAVSNR